LKKAEPLRPNLHQSYLLEVVMRLCKNYEMKGFWNLSLFCVVMFALSMSQVFPAASDTILPEKTRITLQLNNHLSTKVNSEGDAFTAYVTAPILIGDRIVIPKGSVVAGSISRILRPGRFKGKAVMNLLFQSINIPGRGQLPIVASLAGVDSQGHGAIRSEGTVEGEGSEGNDIGRVLAPGIAGAGIGTLTGGAKGAAIGSGVGAAIGLATVFATRGKEIEVRRGATLDILLDQPLTIPPEEGDAASANR
jgi:type IV secretion system protein VirB10